MADKANEANEADEVTKEIEANVIDEIVATDEAANYAIAADDADEAEDAKADDTAEDKADDPTISRS